MRKRFEDSTGLMEQKHVNCLLLDDDDDDDDNFSIPCVSNCVIFKCQGYISEICHFCLPCCPCCSLAVSPTQNINQKVRDNVETCCNCRNIPVP